MAAAQKNLQIVLASRPVGMVKESDFATKEVAYPALKDGEVLLAARYISVDPYLRGRIREHKLDEVMVSGVVSEVVAVQNNAEFKAGDFVQAYLPWQLFVAHDGKGLRKLDPAAAPVSTALGVLGMPGMTAYFGLFDVAALKKEDVVLISGAAGAVGSVAGQIAKALGCRVIGTAGGPDKVKLCIDEFGFDACIDYKVHDTVEKVKAALAPLAPKGIDVYFDNTGGAVTDAAFDLLNKNGRVAVCGQISMYNSTDTPMAPLFLHKLIYKSITVKGFVVSDYAPRALEFYRDVGKWLKEGKMKYKETVFDGFESLPKAFIGLFHGVNTGKALVKV